MISIKADLSIIILISAILGDETMLEDGETLVSRAGSHATLDSADALADDSTPCRAYRDYSRTGRRLYRRFLEFGDVTRVE